MQPAEDSPRLRVVQGEQQGPAARPPVLNETPRRPPQNLARWFRAYWTTWIVVFSYLSLQIQSRFRSDKTIELWPWPSTRRNAARIQDAIVDLQGLFIKVGQLVSIMTNFLPPEFRGGLERLRDQVPPRPYPDIEARFREEFGGRTPEQLFASFEQRPIAAASIGQVHVAELASGQRVAVKVQYPDIESIVRSDLGILKRIFGILSWFLPNQNFEAAYGEIKAMLLLELDFNVEAGNVRAIAANFENQNEVLFPHVVDELSTSRVITTHWLDGIKIGDVIRTKTSINRRVLAQRVIEAYCQQIFVNGLYHADPHPGNLMVRADDPEKPQVMLLDFGAVAHVSERMRRGIVDFIHGAAQHDNQRVIKALQSMGFIARGADPRVYDRVVEYFHQRFHEEVHLDSLNLKDLRFDPRTAFQNLADLRSMDISLGDLTSSFHAPKEWIHLERTLLLLMGLCTELDPDLNPTEVIFPYLEQFVLGPDRDWSHLVVDTSKELGMQAIALPGELRRFLTAAQRGQLELGVRNLDDATRTLYSLGHQVIWTLGGIGASSFALVFDGRGQGPQSQIAWSVAGACGVFLLGSMWATRIRHRRRR